MIFVFQIVVLIAIMLSILGMVGDEDGREFYIKLFAVSGLTFLLTIAIERIALL